MKQAEKMVMAYGADGLQPTPESQTVKVQVCPVAIDCDKGTPFTPRLARFFMCEGIDTLPTKLVSIEPPGTLTHKLILEEKNGGTFCYVKKEVATEHWRVTVRFDNERGRSGGNLRTLAILAKSDLIDPYFSNLSATDRQSLADIGNDRF